MNTIIKEDIKEMENILENVLSPFTNINIEYEAWRLVEEEGWHREIKNKEKDKMTDELTFDERIELLDTAIHFIINCYLKNVFPKQKDFVLDVRKTTEIYAPSELDKILEEEGWERLDFETNGWEQDTWYYYKHPDYDFLLTMEYSGFYGDIKLYRKDIDD